MEPNKLDLAEITRIGDLDKIYCQIVSKLGDCIVASELSDSLDLDGICLLPGCHIASIKYDYDRVDFYRAALSTWGSSKVALNFNRWLGIDFQSCIDNLIDSREVVAIHIEMEDPEVAFVGRIVSRSMTEIELATISARGILDPDLYPLKLNSISKIEINTRYLTAVSHACAVLSP